MVLGPGLPLEHLLVLIKRQRSLGLNNHLRTTDEAGGLDEMGNISEGHGLCPLSKGGGTEGQLAGPGT